MSGLQFDAPGAESWLWATSDVRHEEIGLARSVSCVETALSSVGTVLLGSTITFDVPHELDVWVLCRVPYVGSIRRGSVVTIELTDEHGLVHDAVGLTTVRRGQVGLATLNELVPAGSGTVTRTLRGQVSCGRGYANLDGLGRVTMDAYIR